MPRVAQVRTAVARRTHRLAALMYLPVGLHFWRQGAPGWAIAADAAAYLAVMLLVLPTCMALAEVSNPTLRACRLHGRDQAHCQQLSGKRARFEVQGHGRSVAIAYVRKGAHHRLDGAPLVMADPVLVQCGSTRAAAHCVAGHVAALLRTGVKAETVGSMCLVTGADSAELRAEGGARPGRAGALLAESRLWLPRD